MFEAIAGPERVALLNRATVLTVLTICWNVVEGLVAIAAASLSGSVALLGFGADSFIESSSAFVMLWRLSSERRALSAPRIAQLDQKAHRLIGGSLFMLAAFVGWQAIGSLVQREHAQVSVIGIAITSLSLSVMFWLARAKRRTALALGSRAMEADAFQTSACWWLSLMTLGGILLNATFGWWWADPVAALGMTILLVKEGREGWRGNECC